MEKKKPLVNIFEVREPKSKKDFNCPLKIVELMQEEAKADKELFYVIHLTVRNKLIQKELLALGTVDQCPVYIREVFKSALLNQSGKIITVHNHPSGETTPSVNDLSLFRALNKAGKLLQVEVVDHIIISPTGYFAASSKTGLMDC